jgi:Fic family protein
MSSTKSPLKDKAIALGIDLRKADADYKPFPSFEEWSKCYVDTTRWDRYTTELKERRGNSPALLLRALEVVKRAASFDTGALEGLYETDQGFTITVATQAAMWESSIEQKGPQVRALFESQLHAYDYVLDFATQAVPIAEAWIRNLQAQICDSQDTYRVWTEMGWQEQQLPKGEYKHLPNHVVQADGTIHSYAPVDMTPTEMYRLCEELRSEAFLSAHPVLQASYAHYALVVIHPFADGNGRVARALASVFTYRDRDASVPLLILVDNRKEYLSSLRAADGGDFQPFVDFILERTLDAIQMASESIRAAGLPSIEEGVAKIKRLYTTKGGYTHDQVDKAGLKYFELLHQEITRQLKQAIDASGNKLAYTITRHEGGYGPVKSTSRLPLPLGHRLKLSLTTPEPAQAQVVLQFGVEVPQDCEASDDLIIQVLNTKELFETRAATVIPAPSAALQMRISIWVQKIISETLQNLSIKASESLKKKGY